MTKPLRIRKFDPQTKSKAIIEVYWAHLKGNKTPYLSVQIVDVKKGGVRLHNYEEKKEFIKGFDGDMWFLLDNHLAKKGTGVSCHYLANAWYHYKLAKNYLIAEMLGEVFTEQDKTEQIVAIKKKVLDDLTELTDRHLKRGGSLALREYRERIEKDLEVYYYTRETRLSHYKEELARCAGVFGQKTNKQFDEWVVGYRKAKGELEALDKKPVMSESEIWTIERFSNDYELPKKEVKEILSKPLTQDQLNSILSPVAEEKEQYLTILSDQYQIPTIEG